MLHKTLSLLILLAVTTTRAQEATGSQEPHKPCVLIDSSPQYRINRVNDATIEQEKKIIAADVSYNVMVRAGLKACISIASLYAVYKIVLSKDEATPLQAHELASADQLNIRLGSLEKRFDAWEPTWFSWQWVKNGFGHLSKNLASMLATKYLFDTGETVFQSVFHQANSQWFINSRTRLITLMQELQEYAQKFDTITDPVIKNHCAQEIVFISNDVIKQCTSIIAFMEFSTESLPPASAEIFEGATLIAYLKLCTHDFSVSLEQKLNEQEESILPTITEFGAEVGRTMMSFNRIEKPVIQ